MAEASIGYEEMLWIISCYFYVPHESQKHKTGHGLSLTVLHCYFLRQVGIRIKS
jgi:hypothetical protein